MVKECAGKNPKGLVFIFLGILFITFSNPRVASQQPQQLTQDEFNQELRKAYIQNDDKLANSLIRNNRLFVKSFVNDLIVESIDMELKGKSTESMQAITIAEKAANNFENIYGETSLQIGVDYLTSWTKEQKEKKLVADSLYSFAAGLRNDSRFRDRVIEYYEQSLALYSEIGDERGEAEVLGGFGFLYYNVDFEKSLGYYQQALIKREKVDDRQLTGNTYNSIGAIYYSYFQDYDQALSYYEKAEAIRKEIGDSVNLGRTVHVEASAYEKTGQLEKSLEYYQQSYEINQKSGDPFRATQAMLNSGTILNGVGRYAEALENLEKALEINENVNDSLEIGVVLNHIGFVYSNLGNYNTAVEYIMQAAEIMEQLDDMWELAGVYNHLGIVLQNAGRTERAYEYYNNSLKIYEEQEDIYNVLALLSNLGTLFFDMKDYTRAEEYHNRGLQISREIKDKDQEVRCLLNLANDQSLLGKLDEARSNYETGYEIAASLNNPDLIWRLIAGLAENYEQRGEYDKAVELNDSALVILEGLRNTLPSEDWKASFMAVERFAFEDVISMLGDLHEKEKTKGYDMMAFRYAERSKSRAFLDLLAESLANVNEGADMELLKRQDEILISITEAKQALQNESLSEQPDEQIVNDLKENIKSAEVELNEIRREMRITNPRYAELQYPQPVSLEEVQALCPDKNTVFLEYSLGDSSSFLWVITRSGHQLYKLPGRKTLQEQIETLRFALLNPDQDNNAFFTEASCFLYDQLIKPAEPYFSKKSRLVIIPGGILNYLPFEVLLTENKEISPETSYSDLPFLVKKYPISYVQSASVLKSLLSDQAGDYEPKSGSQRLIAFGDPVYENTNNASPASGVRYNRLEFSGKEVEKISSFFTEGSAEVYLRDAATEENVKQNGELEKFDYIHFATHGFIDEEKPDFSSLVLTKGEKSSEDGFLQATEIFNLNLDADLVVLSACQTGLGKMIRGEGMVGLTRAFMYAGTPSVLASLWSVSDISTATLMGEFYKYLIKNKFSKTDALREAQLTLVSDEQLAHPFYWAPFILIGDWK